MCVPTSSRVSRESIRRLRVEPALRLGQPVADFLEAAGQPGIVEHEADVILDDPQALTRTIGRGVEDPSQVDAASRLGQIQRGDPFGQRERSRVDLDLPRQAFCGTAESPGRPRAARPRRGRRRR